MVTRGVIVLDIDDTLYLERDYIRSGLSAVSEWATDELGLSGLFDHAWSEFERGHRGDLFDRALRSLGLAVTREIIARHRCRQRRPTGKSAREGNGTRPRKVGRSDSLDGSLRERVLQAFTAGVSIDSGSTRG
jgi:hypothetical protein